MPPLHRDSSLVRTAPVRTGQDGESHRAAAAFAWRRVCAAAEAGGEAEGA